MAVEAKNTKFQRTKPTRLQQIRQGLDNPVAVRAELCRRDLSEFIKYFWDAISNDELQWNWHLDYLSFQLVNVAKQVAAGEPRKNDMIVNIPPGTTKSMTMSVMFPVWCWANWPWMKFIATSYSGALALEQAELSRDLVRSDKFKMLYPDLSIRQDKDTKSNFKIQRKLKGRQTAIQGGNRYSTSVGGTLTGFHGHMLIVDDPIDPNRAVSEAELATANRWISQTLSTRKIDKAVTPTLIIMQRLAQDDPTGHILEKKSNVFHVCLPGEIRNYKNVVNPPELAENYVDGLLDPKRMSWDVLNDLEADLGQYGYAGQIGQKPTPPAGGMFKVDNMPVLSDVPNPVNCLEKVWYWDKAGSKDEGARSCGVYMWRMDKRRFPYEYVVVKVVKGQWESNEREQILKDSIRAEDPDARIYVEQEPGSGGKESAQNTIKNLAGFYVEADRPTGDKIYRADPFSVQVNNGNVAIVNGPWLYDFKEELRYFPYSKFKDQADSGSGAFAKLSLTNRAGVW